MSGSKVSISLLLSSTYTILLLSQFAKLVIAIKIAESSFFLFHKNY